MTPEEIRAIRRELGLSQVEAGELLGGGPRAFTKYEAGAVRPAASIVNLLRLLENNPAMLATLQGRKSRPMTAGSASHPFNVTGEHISALTERMFPQLLRRLLGAEAVAFSLPTDGIHVTSSIHAPDGGEDGRIVWEGGPDRTAFLPFRFCQFQLKAGKIGAAQAGKEVLGKSEAVKEMVRAVLKDGGHYIMLCSRPYVEKGIQTRKTSICQALRSADLVIRDSQVHFRDADQMADWTNRYPSVATWVLEQTQPGTVGPFRSWSHWAGRSEHEASPWVEDERLPALRVWLRERTTEPRGVVRVVGLSGVGKSRLILEALGPSEGESRAFSDMVLYADESEAGPQAVRNVVQTWADTGERAVVVADRCPIESHRALAGMVSRSSSGLSLITIDNEIPSGTLDSTTIQIAEAPPSVIDAIVIRSLPGLPFEDMRRLVRFSKGFPGIAIRIASTWNESIPISHATDDCMANAFVLGHRPREPELLNKAAMLLAAFGTVGIGEPVDGQLGEIATVGRGVTADDLRAAIGRLLVQGAAQRRGRFVVLQPRLVALYLTEHQWREWAPRTWDKVLAGDFNSSLKTRASRRLAEINTTDIAGEVLRHVCRHGGSFDGFQGLSRAGHAEALSWLTEIDPRIVADQIDRSLRAVEDLSRIEGYTRRHLVWALEKIAFHPDTFEDGARLLLRLAVAENEPYGNNATGLFKALFPVCLGNTAADGDSRFAILDEAADTSNPAQRSILVDALLAGAKTDKFVRRVSGAESHGLRPALTEWLPVTQEAADDYVGGCVRRLVTFAERNDAAGIAARTGLGHHLRSLVGHGFIDVVETLVDRLGGKAGPWAEAMESLGHWLEYDAADNDCETIERVERLIATLQPRDWEVRVRYLVTEMPWDYPCGEKLDFETREQRQVEAVQVLAAELVRQPTALGRVLTRLSRGQQRMTFRFGKAIAESAGFRSDWLERISRAVTETPESERNFDLMSGYVVGIAKEHPTVVEDFKKKMGRSPNLAPALPLICWRLGIRVSDISLVLDALQADLLPPWRLQQWSFGGVLAKVPAHAVTPLFDTMLDHSAEGFSVTVELMGMYAHGAPDKLNDLRPQIRKCAENIVRWEQVRGSARLNHHFEAIMAWLLGKGRQNPEARVAALILSDAVVDVVKRNNGQLLRPVIPLLLSDFPEIAWLRIGQAIIDDRLIARHLEIVLGQPFSFDREKKPSILSLPEDVLFAWCRAHPDHAPAFVAATVPILTAYGADISEGTLHPITSRLIDEFGGSDDVRQALDRNIHTFSWKGSRTTYYALHREPLAALRGHTKPQVRRWAASMQRNLEKEIENAHHEDEEEEVLRDV